MGARVQWGMQEGHVRILSMSDVTLECGLRLGV